MAEIHCVIEERERAERERLLKMLETVRNGGTANLCIVDYKDGSFTIPYGVDLEIDRKLVVKVLRKAKFIKSGSFSDTGDLPVIKVTGTLDLAEEVSIPELDPKKSHPYIQRQLAEKLGVEPWDIYSMVWHFGMKGR